MSQQSQIIADQLADLLHNAPQDGVTANAVGLITPVLSAIASKLGHPSYFMLQSEQSNWLMTTLSNRDSPEIEKNVVYAYCSQTAANVERLQVGDPKLVCVEIGVIDILFQLLGLKAVDSLIFFDQVNNSQAGVEISNADLQNLCEKQIKRVKSSHLTRTKSNFAAHIA